MTPYEQIGGAPRVKVIVGRFYDLMEEDPQYKALRAMHGENLAPMRTSLEQFLAAWFGGPRDWFSQNPGTCIMSMHRALPISDKTAGQWLSAMKRSVDESAIEAGLSEAIMSAFTRMASGMMARPPESRGG